MISQPMLKKDKLLIFCFACVITTGCKSTSRSAKLEFEPVNSDVYSPNDDYQQALSQWKSYYQYCTSEPLFRNAFYLQLQDKIYIGSINSRQGIDINKGTVLLDTGRHFANAFKLLSIQNAFNCYDTMKLAGNLKQSFYNEVIECLNAPGYKGLTTVIDTTQMKVRISTLYTIELVPEKLIDLFDTTKDTSLIRFKELLLKPGNVLLSETVEVLGFTADFPLRINLSREQQAQFTKGVYFNLSNSNDNASLILLANNNLRIQLNKRFTVLGKFLQLKKNE
jgi:hypothetical protein